MVTRNRDKNIEWLAKDIAKSKDVASQLRQKRGFPWDRLPERDTQESDFFDFLSPFNQPRIPQPPMVSERVTAPFPGMEEAQRIGEQLQEEREDREGLYPKWVEALSGGAGMFRSREARQRQVESEQRAQALAQERLRTTGELPTRIAEAPLFEIAGVPISASTIVAAGLIGYGAYQGVRAITPLVKNIGDKAYQQLLNKSLGDWVVYRTRDVQRTKPEQFKTAKDFLWSHLVKNKVAWQERATDNFKARMAQAKAAKTGMANARTQAVNDTIRDIEEMLVPRATQTGAMAMGGKVPVVSEASWTAMTVPERVALTQSAGLSGQVASKAFGQLTPEEITALSKITPQPTPTPTPEVTTTVPNVQIQGNKIIRDDGLELGILNQSAQMPVSKTGAYQGYTTKQLDKMVSVYDEALDKPPVAPEVVEAPPIPSEEVVAPVEGRITPTQPQPPESQPPVTPPEQAMLEGVPSEWEGLMPNLRSATSVLDIMTKEDDWRIFANLPIMKQIMSHFNPATTADTPHLKYKIIRSVFRFESSQRSKVVMSHLDKMGGQEKIFGKVDSKGLIATGKLKGLAVNDIRTNPKKYADKLTQEQKEWIVSADEIEVAKLDFLKRNGIAINELGFEDGGQYAGRRWLFKRTSDGTMVESATVGPGPGRPGKKLGAERHRTFKTQAEGIKAGFFPMPENEALALNVQGAYNRVADKQAAEWLLTQVDWRTTGAPEELILAAEAAKLKLQRSRQLLAALNRAVRGERVPDVTINSIARTYPNEAQRLKDLIPKIQEEQPTAKRVQALTGDAKALIETAQKERWQTVAARARAREIAMKVGYEEGAVSAPAFAGKIFTGSEARELTRAINKDLQTTAPDILRAVNKVNAVSRFFMLAGDFSPMMIQLLFLAGGNPKVYGQAGVGMLRGLFDPRFLPNYYANNRDLINANPDLILSGGGSTEFTEAMAKGGLLSGKMRLIPQEEAFLKNMGLLAPRLVGKIGATVLIPFQGAFESAIDVAGIEMRKALEYMVTDAKSQEEVNMFVNEFRGVTSSERIGVSPTWRESETAAILAPRYNRAIASLLFDVGRGTIRGNLARKYLARGIFAVIMAAVAISIARREDPLKHLDPRSTEFMTWNVEGQQVGPGSKIRSLVRLLGQWTKAIQAGDEDKLFELSMENPSIRFIRGNLSPAVGASIDILTGRNFIGDPTRDGMSSFTKEILISNLTPIWVENVLMEGGTVVERGIRGLAEFMGGRAYPETTWDKVKPLREEYAKQDYGVDYESLNSAQIKELRSKHPDLDELEAGAKEEWVQKGSDYERWYFEESERVTKERNDNLEFAAKALLEGRISKYEYDAQRKYIRPYYSGGKAVLWSSKTYLDAKSVERINRWMAENQKPEDRYLDKYYEFQAALIDKSELPRDWEKIESFLQAFLSGIPTEMSQYVLDNKDRWMNDLPPAAKGIEMMRSEGIDNESWWDDYREK